jgi:PIN domain nuclease of toxin-antitoxin system
MDNFVVDTHPLVFYAAGALSRLGRRARAAFEGFEKGKVALYVPAPAVIETWLLARGGRLKMKSGLGAWWRDIERVGMVHVPLEAADVIHANELDWQHRDVFDRMIVSTALRLDLPLISGDDEIAEWGGVEVCW